MSNSDKRPQNRDLANSGQNQNRKDGQQVLPEVFPPELKEALNGLPRDKQNQITRAFISVQHSSPYPPPDFLQGYNEAIPNGAERLFNLTERQSTHRMELEKMHVSGQKHQSALGQRYGFILALLLIGASTWLGYLGHDWLAGILATTTVLGLATVFVLGKVYQEKNLQAKRE